MKIIHGRKSIIGPISVAYITALTILVLSGFSCMKVKSSDEQFEETIPSVTIRSPEAQEEFSAIWHTLRTMPGDT